MDGLLEVPTPQGVVERKFVLREGTSECEGLLAGDCDCEGGESGRLSSLVQGV